MANIVIPMDVYKDTAPIISVRSTETLDDGFLVVADALNATDEMIYDATKPTAITADFIALVASNEFAQDANKNRINITDKTKYDYPAGLDVTAYRLEKGRKFLISNSAITGTPAVGGFLIPTANSFALTYAATLGGTEKFALKIEKINKSIHTGISNTTKGVIARVVLA